MIKIDSGHIVVLGFAILCAVCSSVLGVLHPNQQAFIILSAVLSALTTVGALVKASIFPTASAKAAIKAGLAKAIVPIAALAMVVSVAACGFLKSNEGALTADGAALAACVVSEALSGETSAVAIAVKCGAPSAVSVLGLLGSLAKDLSAPAEAGKVGGPDHSDVLARIRAVH